MSLRLTSEDGLAAYLTAASKPAELYVQAGHRIADLQLPACIVHAESSAPVVEGSLATTRKVTFACSILTPIEVASTVTAHRTNFDWLNTKLTAVTTIYNPRYNASIEGISSGASVPATFTIDSNSFVKTAENYTKTVGDVVKVSVTGVFNPNSALGT